MSSCVPSSRTATSNGSESFTIRRNLQYEYTRILVSVFARYFCMFLECFCVGLQSLEKFRTLSGDVAGKSLCEAVRLLAARTSLIAPQNLDAIDGRLTILIGKLNQIAEKRELIQEMDKQNKVWLLLTLIFHRETV